jgi:transglutaminase-like putative cysteine protease
MKTRGLLSRRLVLSTALILTAFCSLAKDSAGQYEGPYWAFLDSKEILKTGQGITTEKYPDSDDATVERKMLRVYRSDGTGESQDESVVKVLTEKGKRGDRTISLSFTLPYSTVEVAKLEVIRPTGEVIPVDIAANSKETIDDSQMAMNIYDPNSKILRVNIPSLEIGDLVHSVTRTTTLRAVMPGEFADLNVFEAPGYIRHMSYEVRAPLDKPLKKIVLRDEIKGTVQYTTKVSGGVTVHHWEINNVSRMFDEPSMPPYENVLQRLLVSTTPDWETVSKWYWQLSKPHLDATAPEMKQSVDELIQGAKSDREKIQAIFNFVAKKVRYMGLTPEKDRPGFEPHDVCLTFGKKYGVCRDKAALLVSLLRAAGFNSYPVLINVGSKVDPEGPNPGFNHAIVSVDQGKRDYLLMDPTDENTKELLPSSDRDQSFLVCRPEGETIRISPINPAEENMLTVKTTGTLTAAGVLQARSDVSFEGVNDNSYRESFAHMKPDDRVRFFERVLKRMMPGARLNSLHLTPEDMLDVSSAVHAVIDFSAEGMNASGNGKDMVSMPWLGKGLGIVNFILGGAGLEERKYPLQTFVACGFKEEVAINTSSDFTAAVSLPSCSPLDDPSMSYQEHFGFKDGVLSGSRELKLKTVEFSPKQYSKLKNALKLLDYDERKTPVLALSHSPEPAPELAAGAAPPEVESDAKILDSHKEIEIKDAHTMTLKGRYSKLILNYAGKKREAEVKLDYNPSCQEAKIIRATVTSKSGQKQELAKDEINVMDAGWNASANRYTGGKVLVANLPGIDIGSTIEVEYELTAHDKPFLAGFEQFQLGDDLEEKTVVFKAPENLPVRKLVSGSAGLVKEQRHTANGQQVFEWHAEHVKALPAEQQLPPEWLFLGGVTYCAGDAGEYWRRLNDAMIDRAGNSAKAAAKAHELAAQAKTKLQTLEAIRDFISKSIRSAGPVFTDLPLSELSGADTTLADGYGHTADRAILYYAMLKAAGFDPQLVLASGLPPIAAITNVTSAFAMPQTFQTPLVRVAVDGQQYYLNDTDQYARIGTTPHEGRLALVLASGAAETIQPSQGCDDKTEITYSFSLTDAGKTQLSISRRYFGTGYNAKHRFFSELPPEERRRYYQEIVSGVTQGAQPMGDLVTQFDSYPGTEQFAVQIDNYAVVDGKYLYFDLPFSPSLLPAGTEHRTLPLFVSHHNQSTIRTEIELPAGFKQVVIAPASSELTAPDGAGVARTLAKNDAGKFVLTHEFETWPTIIYPKDYSQLLKLESTLGQKASRVFLLQGQAIAE